MTNKPNDTEVRLQELEKVEENIIKILQTSGECVLEISKEQPNTFVIQHLTLQGAISDSKTKFGYNCKFEK